MTINKIQVRETVRIDAPFDGKLKHIISQLQDWMTEGEWEGIVEEPYGYDGAVEYYLYKHREETDKEYEERMKQLEKEKAEKTKAKERKLEKLKKDLASLSDADKKLLGL
jgi:hypothetical protein